MIHIGIISFDRLDMLKRLITGEHFIADAQAHDARVFVLDQGSADGTGDWLAAYRAPYRLSFWESGQYLNLVASRLRVCDRLLGAGLARDDVLIMLDDDCWISKPGWIAALTEQLKQPGVGITGQEAFAIAEGWSGFTRVDGRMPGACDVVSGSIVAVRGEVLHAGVEYDMMFQPCWHEDSDFCLQARAKGYAVHGVPRTIGIEHDSHRKVPDTIYYRNLHFLRARHGGKLLIEAERKAKINGADSTPVTAAANADGRD